MCCVPVARVGGSLLEMSFYSLPSPKSYKSKNQTQESFQCVVDLMVVALSLLFYVKTTGTVNTNKRARGDRLV